MPGLELVQNCGLAAQWCYPFFLVLVLWHIAWSLVDETLLPPPPEPPPATPHPEKKWKKKKEKKKKKKEKKKKEKTL